MKIVNLLILATTLSGLYYSSSSLSAGIALHRYSTELAGKNVSDPELKALLRRFRSTLYSAASFPDGGYPFNYHWAEPAHWAPFIQAYADYVKEKCLGQYETYYCGNLTAHFMGAIGHSIQDQIFDELFVERVLEVDGFGQEGTDAGLDPILLHDVPESRGAALSFYVPVNELKTVFKHMELDSVNSIELFLGRFIIKLGDLAENLFFPFLRFEAKNNIPWATQNYIEHPGGVIHMGATTAALYDHYWKYINDIPDDNARLTPFPMPGETNVAPDLIRTETQIGLILDRSFIPNTLNSDSFYVKDTMGQLVSGRIIRRTPAFSNIPQTHVIRFRADNPLLPLTTYQATLTPEVLDENGAPLTNSDFNWQFTTGNADN